MKKLLLLLAITFVFGTISFANNKHAYKKLEIKKETFKLSTNVKKQQESCVVMHVFTSTYYDSATNELISTNTYVTYDVDLPCLVNLALGMMR